MPCFTETKTLKSQKTMFHPQGPSLWELTVQAMSSTTRGYDLLAPKFEFTPFRTPDHLLGPMADAIGPPGSIEAALDICCGNGAALRAFRPLCTSHITGIDLSAGMIAQARALADKAPGDAEVRLLQADAFAMPFEGEFDVATCCGAFGHILQPDQDRFAQQVRKVLKPGGRFVFVTRVMPSITSKQWWMARGFNAVMHARNAVYKPPFIMFYLTFTLGRVLQVLPRHGFDVDVRDVFPRPYHNARVIVATRR